MIASGVAVWLTGLPASGKTTLAHDLVDAMRADGAIVLHFDSDVLRPYVIGNGGFGDDARERFYRWLGYMATITTEAGADVVISATAHRRAWRDGPRAAIARFVEVFLDVDVATCRARDPKGLWRSAAAGAITTLPGAGVSYEPPLAPEVRLGAEVPRDEAIAQIRRAIDAARK